MKKLWLKIKEWSKKAWKGFLTFLGIGVAAVALITFNGAVEEPVANVASETICESNDGTDARFFAEVENGVILRVIVAQPEVLNTGKFGSPDKWVETCYGGKGNRKNYAGKGYTFDKTKNGFIAPKLRADATLDELNLKWVVPATDLNNPASQ